ncbi:MAG: DNA polymerase III subunit gamma/tau [Candidatus Buchananbacteria bacterium]|nr:DNA polymerase III subunit gamma/tau [Candidatus Buchananbacteria bacterium]
MALALYRKYRPQSFKDLVGQNHIKTTIQNELETGKVAHAYLFSGPRGLGKTTMARLLAKAVNCLNRKDSQSEPCNTCAACLELMENKSLDVIEIDAASHTGVDNVRENIIGSARFTPTSRKFKVFIIDEVHMLSISAFNALLKTLEEPPAHAIFVLATTEIHKVPQTIISRCQHFEFRKVADSEVLERLNHIARQEGIAVEASVLESVAYYAGGCLRDAESLLGQILSLGGKKITAEQAELVLPRSRFDLALEFISLLNKSDAAGAITLVNELVQEGLDLEKFTEETIELLRKILLLKINSQLTKFSGSFNKDLEKKINELSQQTSLNFLMKAIDVLLAKKLELRYAEILQLPLELAVLEIIQANPTDTHDDSAGLAPDSKTKTTETKKTVAKPKTAPMLAKVAEAPLTQPTKVGITLNQIKSRWQDVLNHIKDLNYSLASTLKIANPSALSDDGTLEVCFEHKFHQQRVNDLKNKKTVEDVLHQIFGTPLILKTVVVNAMVQEEINQPKNDEAVNVVLQSFGGRLIE